MLDLVLSDEEYFNVEIDYWKEKLHGLVPLHLATDFARPKVTNSDRSITEFFIDKEINSQLNTLSTELNVSPFTILLSTFKVLLFRYSNQEDICVNNIVAGSQRGLYEENGECHTNILALRSTIGGDDKFTDILKRVKNTTHEAYQYQKVPFEKIVDNLKGISHEVDSLFRVMFLLKKDEDAKLLRNEFVNQQTQKHDLSFILTETKNGIKVSITYSAELFQEGTIERMAKHYQQLLISVIKDPGKSAGALPMLTADEENDIIVKFNNTLTHYPAEKTIADLFEEQVLKTPAAIALRQHDRTMTYAEVNESANRLAHYLVESGVKPGDNIGLIVTRGFDMIIGMYGILKAGGAYVPIDPEYPIDRQEYILNNSSVVKVIADSNYPLENLIAQDRFVKLNTLDLDHYSTENLGIKVDSKQLAYTIYTSGSTGRPKGVMIEHHSAVNLILWVNKEYNIGVDDRLLFITSMCFDLSVYDIFGMLAAGGSIVIVKQEELMDVPKLKDMMKNYGITFWDSVPTTMDYLIRELENHHNDYIQNNLKVVFMSGDWIPVNLPDRIKKYFPKTQVISLGGATEGTVWSNFYPVKEVGKDWNSVPYGKPLANNFFYILNDQLQPVPIGVTGELYIGGVGVARGYANDKEKTERSFIKDPFNNQAGGRMYKTGDLGRMLPSLNMEFIGRKDDQVKIRGYRIELGEIESVLRQCNLVKQAVVLAKADKEGKKRLVSYVVGKGKYDRETVISFLKSKLPDYMIPTLWMELDELPLTSNNKIDKKTLPDFDAEEQLKDKYVAPRNQSEKFIASIWQEVLKIKEVGVYDNFFDIGGHSLLAVQIMSRIENKTGKKFPIAILFKYPTIESLNGFIQDSTAVTWKSLIPIKPSGNKMPIYIVHGIGLNVLNFSSLAALMDSEQPVFGLQARGLDGIEEPLDNLAGIAQQYVDEILEHNPGGPYAIAGYSIGSFIAFEMARHLLAMGREVKMVGIFDMDAEVSVMNKPWLALLPFKIKRYLPKFMGGHKSVFKQLAYLAQINSAALSHKLGIKNKPEFYVFLEELQKKHELALKKYQITPLNIGIHLFKAKVSIHYNDDDEYLAWKKYAMGGVNRYMVPGEHETMLVSPNVSEFATILQSALDNC